MGKGDGGCGDLFVGNVVIWLSAMWDLLVGMWGLVGGRCGICWWVGGDVFVGDVGFVCG